MDKNSLGFASFSQTLCKTRLNVEDFIGKQVTAEARGDKTKREKERGEGDREGGKEKERIREGGKERKDNRGREREREEREGG